MKNSKIQWTDDTWNPWRGCAKVSPGCKNCYAELSTPVRVARSKGRELWGGTLRDRAKDFDAPLRWNQKPWICDICGSAHIGTEWEPNITTHGGFCKKCESTTHWHRRRVFSLSLGDWLDDAVPIEWLADMLDVIRCCPNLDFLLLTKRPENWSSRLMEILHRGSKAQSKGGSGTQVTGPFEIWLIKWLLKMEGPANVWIGTTVENQEYADKRIPELLKIPAVCRFISYEPALGPVDFGLELIDPIAHYVHAADCPNYCDFACGGYETSGGGIDWIIVGGESGSQARPFNVEWARSTMAQSKAAGVACFVKQMGSKPSDRNDAGFEGETTTEWPLGAEISDLNREDTEVFQGKLMRIHLGDKKGGDMAEWPEDLRVREFPIVKVVGDEVTRL
jgi:protein gp37